MNDNDAPVRGGDGGADEGAVSGAAADLAATDLVASPSRFRRFRHSASTPVTVAIVVGAVIALLLSSICGLLGYRAYEARQQEQLRQLLLQVGRQGAVNLTTIDYGQADADVKRILDSATGQFYDEFSTRAGPFIEVLKRTQSKSVGTISAAGAEAINGEEGQILVAVSVKTTNRGTPDPEPRFWRMRLTVTKQGSDAKVSKVEFVP